MWNASRFCVSSLRWGHANLLCIVPILVYVQPKLVHLLSSKQHISCGQSKERDIFIHTEIKDIKACCNIYLYFKSRLTTLVQWLGAWHALVILLSRKPELESVWGGEFWLHRIHAELVSALRLTSTWPARRSPGRSGWLMRDESGQRGNQAAKNPQVSQ